MNGNITIAPTSLKTKSRVKPIIRKGNSMIQISGNRNIANRASGQQRINRINHRKNVMNIFMLQFVVSFGKRSATNKNVLLTRLNGHDERFHSLSYSALFRLEH